MRSVQDYVNRYSDFDKEFWPLYEQVKKYTMTSPERLYDLYKSVKYIDAAEVSGDIIECGVWKGGSMMLVAAALKMMWEEKFQKTGNDPYARMLYLYDTFAGLPPPNPELDLDLNGNIAAERYRENWASASFVEVQENMDHVAYEYRNGDTSKFTSSEGALWPMYELCRGMVEYTLPKIPEFHQFAIVRLDTDWYASTAVELEVLWPRLATGGLMIIDDYGHWTGCRKAVDEYFSGRPVKMTRVDYSCRVIQKTA